MASQSSQQPEIYWTKGPTHGIPNSRLPVLVYRQVLPVTDTKEAIKAHIEANRWIAKGIWGHIPKAHYHSNTHECYAPISGSTKCLYGVSPHDDPSDGVRFDLKVGDVAVHAAGVAHCHVESSDDYRYYGLYPEGSPQWDSIYIEPSPEEYARKAENARTCPVPDFDPVFGADGPLPKLWKDADAAAVSS